ncbi:Flp pilus assembly protein CpaB [Paeniglutamicibacter kerguelensis]|uniref:Pilus assembly protein CpaB n=1 Tax=Paeniglutamicibacter kerguelensis TaxID=254788 RepID=A0ABS4X8Q3_9MICC|nr:Flp pilus assembly protein CpaB [Paeniglutamicibacter kerguelensis]MBP2384845.1 pilus assembly protein CpaB [Paeniglutamicibacter kerguelensis]
MKTRLLAGTAALVLAIVGAILLYTYVSAADARAQASLNPVQVLVATKNIAAGTPINELGQSLTTKQLPAAAVTGDAVASLKDLDGKVLAQDMVLGEQLLSAKLVTEDSMLIPGTIAVPKGKQEVTVLLEPARVVGSMLRAGDTVGVFGNYTVKDKNNKDAEEEKVTKLLYDKVLVTAIQVAPQEQTSSSKDVAALPSGSAYVTFGVDSLQAAKIIHSQEFGSLWLTKQNKKTPAGNKTPITINEVLK